jgi:plastocyanin
VKRRMLIALSLALAGCAAGGAAPVGDAGTPLENVVEIAASDGFTFAPAHLTVPAGTTVRWTNRGAIPHTVTSGASSRAADNPGALLDRRLPSGATVEFTFSSAGDWPYFCRFHEGMGMVGLVTVTPAAPSQGPAAARFRRSRGTELLAQRWDPEGARSETSAPSIEQRR